VNNSLPHLAVFAEQVLEIAGFSLGGEAVHKEVVSRVDRFVDGIVAAGAVRLRVGGRVFIDTYSQLCGCERVRSKVVSQGADMRAREERERGEEKEICSNKWHYSRAICITV